MRVGTVKSSLHKTRRELEARMAERGLAAGYMGKRKIEPIREATDEEKAAIAASSLEYKAGEERKYFSRYSIIYQLGINPNEKEKVAEAAADIFDGIDPAKMKKSQKL